MESWDNKAFEGDDPAQHSEPASKAQTEPSSNHLHNNTDESPPTKDSKEGRDRDLWGKDIEFLLSCIAMSVGLGNVWRFPFTALENGGGAFVIPYLIVLFLVGKPIYYLEMIIGQFSSRGAIKVYDLCPAMRGTGVGQVVSIGIVTTYYASLMALTVYYFVESFSKVLPWSVCKEEWGSNCVPALGDNSTESNATDKFSSAELYFLKEVLREVDTLDEGIGAPSWKLILCLIGSWVVVYVILIRGIRSSGKALTAPDKMESWDNKAFEGDDPAQHSEPASKAQTEPSSNHLHNNTDESPPTKDSKEGRDRDLWGKDIEFLLSCIAMSVGLGNVWRFPFTALENGGGAFVIPYLIVLFLVGKPIYYLEMIIGQFSSRGAIKVYDLCPAMRGTGVGQVVSIGIVTTYYASLMALTVYYFVESFSKVLPWSVCKEEWGSNCVPALGDNSTESNATDKFSSAELYFLKEVLREVDTLDEGIGAPSWKLILCLIGSWVVVYVILIRGIRSSGKASYFLAIFPYIILLVLLIRAVTLPGSSDGIIYFIKPQWDKILEPKVWYAAVTQVFFSLSVCFGNIIMYASYNKFGHDVYRDATIVTLLDTATSLLAGCTIFGILGNLAYQLGTTDVGTVVKSETGLAFISYPDAIAKFDTLPQLFSVLFFLMLFVLGVGSNIAMTSCVMTSIRDKFPKVKNWHAALGIAVFSVIVGLVYLTPGGQFILNLVDHFGASMIALVLAIGELFTLSWIYGVRRLCKDAEFMIGRNPGLYWRVCWGIVTPLLMTAILIYTFATYEPLVYKGITYPDWAYAIGWCIAMLGILQVPLWACVAIIRQPGNSWSEKIRGAFKPTKNWGPRDAATLERYQKSMSELEDKYQDGRGLLKRMWSNVFD